MPRICGLGSNSKPLQPHETTRAGFVIAFGAIASVTGILGIFQIGPLNTLGPQSILGGGVTAGIGGLSAASGAAWLAIRRAEPKPSICAETFDDRFAAFLDAWEPEEGLPKLPVPQIPLRTDDRAPSKGRQLQLHADLFIRQMPLEAVHPALIPFYQERFETYNALRLSHDAEPIQHTRLEQLIPFVEVCALSEMLTYEQTADDFCEILQRLADQLPSEITAIPDHLRLFMIDKLHEHKVPNFTFYVGDPRPETIRNHLLTITVKLDIDAIPIEFAMNTDNDAHLATALQAEEDAATAAAMAADG